MELTKGQESGLKKYLTKIGNGLFNDIDFFVNYMGVFPELVVMVDVDWNKLPKEFAYNYEKWLKDNYGEKVKEYFTMVSVPFRGRISFQIMNWPE
jgi:hypothetical protein